MLEWKRIVFLTSCIFLSLISFAQYENVWVWNGRNINGLDFNNGAVMPFRSAITGLEAHAMVCDGNGRLLFYTNGNNVWNRNHQLMPNGYDLLELPGLTEPVHSTNQGTVIVPIPNDPNKYYIFSLVALTGGGGGYAGRLYYSIVDMRLNNNQGDIDMNSKGIFLAENFMEGITAVVGERCNIWLLALSHKDSSLYAFEITASGMDTNAVVSPIGIPRTSIIYIRVSADRRKILLASDNYRLLDFYPSNGKASNMQSLLPPDLPLLVTYPPEFSPDNSKVYASSHFLLEEFNDSLYQYDITLPSVADMYKQRIAITDAAREMRLGPDGKIYFGRKGNIDKMNYPNLIGIACSHQANVLSNVMIGYGGGPSTVPVITHDTIYTFQNTSGGCFANVNGLNIGAINDSTGWDYQWNTGATGPGLRADTPGMYWVTYHTSPCNFHTDTILVRFPNGVLPDITISASCFNAPNGRAYASTYSEDTVRYHYLWQNLAGDTLSFTDTLNGVGAGTYTLQVRTLHCDTSLSFYIPEVDARVSFRVDSIACMGQEVVFDNTSDTYFQQFYWEFGDKSSSLWERPVHSYSEAGNYRVSLTGIGAICKDSTKTVITVDPLLFNVFQTARDSICMGERLVFAPQLRSSSLSTLFWQFGDGTEMASGEEGKLQHAYDVPGTFPVTLTSRFRACPDTSFTRAVYVSSLPQVDLGPDSSLCLNGSAWILSNRQALPVGHYRYSWNTGDTTAQLQVNQAGIYSLTVVNTPLGCSTTEAITISKGCHIDIPNVFTPNGDGINDYFFPIQELTWSVNAFSMQIFDRWGQLLFSSSKLNGHGWDGVWNGKPQPQGVYVYRITIQMPAGVQEVYQGNITLMR